jgi:2,3-diketo-5-methylthio-1-phosphopentane phosphatase
MKKTAQTPILFLDFDGTISRRDVTDVILEQYANGKWQAAETAWRDGRIGSRACLSEQMSLVQATRSQLHALLEAIEIDEGLATLLDLCQTRNVTTHIISDGFDYCIERILARLVNGQRSAIKNVCASHLNLSRRPWLTEFPFFRQSCAHGCATCKPAVMRLLNPTNAPAIFVGDGLSDRYAVECADLVFAKNDLARYCRDNSIEHNEYTTLSEVEQQIKAWMIARNFRRDEDLRRDLSISG